VGTPSSRQRSGRGAAVKHGAADARGATAAVERGAEAVSRFVERFAAIMMESGLPRMPARVFASLLATDSGRLTAAELADSLQVSPAAISGAVRWLAQFNLAGREHVPGSRRDHYRVQDDLWYEASIHREHTLTRWAASAREGVEVLGADTPAGQRMAETLDFLEFVRDEMPALITRWRQHRSTLTRQS
jgi:DNA-binding transcriptional regulator GbsR (MarR family)